MLNRPRDVLHRRVSYLLLTGAIAPALAISGELNVQDLGTLGGRFTVAADINASGQVIGYSETTDGQVHAFLYANGTMQDLGTLGGTGSLANAINDAGQVTGFALTAQGESHAFLYANGAMVDLGPSGTTSSGKAINASGQIAGQATPSGGQSYALIYSGGQVNGFGTPYPTSTSESIAGQGQVAGTYNDAAGTSHAFIYNGTSFADPMPGYSSFVTGTRSINTVGAATGGFQTGSTLHGFVYNNGVATDLGSLGGDYTVPTAISNTGKITGVSAGADGGHHAFLYSAGSLADLGTLGGSFSVGNALNDSDQVTGESESASGQLHAFVTQKGGGLLDIGQAVEGLTSASVTESFGIAINPAGQVVGRYTVSTPSDATMPTTTRSFIANLAASASSLFQDLLSLSIGVGPGKSLIGKVQQALVAYLAHNIPASCSVLKGYEKEVDAQTGKKIGADKAAVLLQKVGELDSAVGCTR